MNITMTWYLTGFIVCRLWSSERRARAAEDYEISSRSGLYNRIIKVLIQSGMLHSVTEAIFLLCIIVGSDNGIAFMSDVEARIIGIVTTLIVLQLNRSGGDNDTTVVKIRPSRDNHGSSGAQTKHADSRQDEVAINVEMTPVNTNDPVKPRNWA
ncbi:hypothetical protein FRB93_013606 [Tulasnella sp. JGI-2019a]|nr:hypothetical protein FRB93_013606 [Tulasnella sp. JGI-2019a]